jgi:hypothetical protein
VRHPAPRERGKHQGASEADDLSRSADRPDKPIETIHTVSMAVDRPLAQPAGTGTVQPDPRSGMKTQAHSHAAMRLATERQVAWLLGFAQLPMSVRLVFGWRCGLRVRSVGSADRTAGVAPSDESCSEAGRRSMFSVPPCA